MRSPNKKENKKRMFQRQAAVSAAQHTVHVGLRAQHKDTHVQYEPQVC